MHLVYVIAPGGGPEAYVRTVTPHLEKYGHRVSIVFAAQAREGISFPPSVRILYAPPADAHYYLAKAVGGFHGWPLRVRAWESARAVYTALDEIDRAEQIDLVETVEGLPVSKFRKRWPVVVRAHGSDWSFRFFCQDGDRRADRWLIELETRQLREACAVTAPSDHLADHLSEFCRFPRERIQVMPLPVDTQLFSPSNRSSGYAPALLTIGRLEKRKGVDVLVSALPRIWPRFPQLTLSLLGRKADLDRKQLLDLVPQEKREHIIFPGYVDHAQLPERYARAAIYVAPTLYETFAYTVLEAMACGVPVVASRVGAIPELVDEGVTGLLIPPGDVDALADAILALLGDPARREQMGKRAREKAVAEYGVDKILARTLEFYEMATK